jgi:hypothetical protein
MSAGDVIPGPAGHYYAVLDDPQFGETLLAYPMSSEDEEWRLNPVHPSEDLEGWGEVADLEEPIGRFRISLEILERLPTVAEGQADNLKIDGERRRVWLSRATAEDGEPCDHKVTEELLLDGSWRTVAIWRAE